MLLPSETDFAEWLAAARQPLALPPHLDWLIARTPGVLDAAPEASVSEGDVRDVLGEIELACSSRWESLRSTNLHAWLDKQRDYERAFNLVYYGRRRRPAADEREESAYLEARAMEIITRVKSPAGNGPALTRPETLVDALRSHLRFSALDGRVGISRVRNRPSKKRKARA